MFYPCPQLRLYFHDGNGHPLVGGKLKTFMSNSTIPIRTVQAYSNAEGTVLNPTEITLDERGECTVFLTAGVIYRFELYDSDGALVLEQDGISVASGSGSGVSDPTIAVESGSYGIDVQQTVMDSGVVLYTISAKKIEDAIEAEKTRAEEAESALSKSITDETERATEAEKGLADSIEAEKNRAEEAERTLSESISQETERAVAAEKAARTEIVAGDNITVEKTVGTDGQDVYTVSGEREDNLVDDVRVNGASVVTDKVANIDVPVAGTASPLMDGKASVGNSLKYAREDHVHPSDTSREDKANKTTVVLGTSDSKYPTDKAVADFVNSSIATNTANYISNSGGPFTSVAQLEAYSGTVTNNDYAFVTGTDSDGNTYYDRYKATVSGSTVTWSLEYRLNNSSFTAAQWAAINSGITSALVSKIHEHGNKAVLDGITSDKVTSWDGKEDAFDILPTTKGGTGTNAAGKSALTSTLINSLSTESSTPEDADYYVSQHANGGTSNNTYVRRPVSALWEYIKNKISSVLGLTSSSYSGKAATAGTADKAVADNSGNNIEETYATKSETEEAISNSIDQKFSSTSKNSQSGVAVNEAFKTRETSVSDNSYTYLGMNKTTTGTEYLYWKLVSFKPDSNYWSLQFEIDVSNGRKSNGSYDTEIYETKRLTIYGSRINTVSGAFVLRYIPQTGGNSRGYDNNIFYETDGSNIVTLYIYAKDTANTSQICRLTNVRNIYGITNITWYEATNDAGTQPTNPVKFEELFPAIASRKSDIGSDSVPVYINRGKPVACSSSNLKAGKDDDGNVIKNTYATKTELNEKGLTLKEISGEQVIYFE